MKFDLYTPLAIHEPGSRKNQEDTIHPALGKVSAESRLFIVCDGMGGYEGGEIASSIACDILAKSMEPIINDGKILSENMVQSALQSVYTEIEHTVPNNGECSTGTTMTLLALHGGGVTAAHLGDSRIYHIRPRTEEILYRSRDHSLVQQLYDLDEITYSEMKTSPKRNVVTKAIIPFHEHYPAEVMHTTDIQPGDYFMLCSDGILEHLEDEEIVELLVSQDKTDEEKRNWLVNHTANNRDNHSAYLIHIKSVSREEQDYKQPNNEAEMRVACKALNDTRRMTPEVSIAEPVDDSNVEEQPTPTISQMPAGENDAANHRSPWVIVFLLTAIIIALLLAVWLFIPPHTESEKGVTSPIGTEAKEEIDFEPYNDNANSKKKRYKTFENPTNRSTTKEVDKQSEEVEGILRDAELRKAESEEKKEKAVREVMGSLGRKPTPIDSVQ